MSKDIRSFFQLKKVPKSKAIADDDEDVIPESPDVHIKNKKKESRKKRILSDDSDEEIFKTKQKKVENRDKKSDNSKKSNKPALKEVKAVDIFGGGPIKRSEPFIKKEKKKTETGIHSDEEFEKSLLELDGIDDNEKKNHGKDEKNDCFKDVSEKKSTSNFKSDIEKKSNNPHDKHENLLTVNKKYKEKGTKLNDEIKEKKRKFDEFIDDKIKQPKHNTDSKNDKKRKLGNDEKSGVNQELYEVDTSTSENLNGSKTKKRKVNQSLNESVLTDEERHERKMHSAALYQKYLNRSAPKHLGAKEIPEGSPGCLKDCAILLTGVLDSFERDEIVGAITKYGGTVKNSVSKKVTYVLAGDDAGPAKMAKAQELGIKILNEDDFLQLIAKSSESKSKLDAKEIKKENTSSKNKNKVENGIKQSKNISDIRTDDKCRDKKSKKTSDSETKSLHIKKIESKSLNIDKQHKNHAKSKSPSKTVKEEYNIKKEKHELKKEVIQTTGNTEKVEKLNENKLFDSNTAMWVDKYKPQNVKQIIGQHGDASNVKKLTNWLTKWYVNRRAKLLKPSPWAKNDDGGYYKAALLSGPPGVGKTTTVSLVCKELGFDMVEFNASDTRNKTLIKEQIGELLTTTSLSAYAKGDTSKQAVTKKHVLVMDEVDGMAGNEDRGGIQELITLIKSTAVPIICMCNDRSSPKMRSLVNYCYDLRFSRPRVDQIKSAMMSICFKEGLKVSPEALVQLIVSAGQDVRQALTLLSLWGAAPPRAQPRPQHAPIKDVKLGPWEAVRKVFSAEEHKAMSVQDKSDLFFYDYNLAPLFVQENYLNVTPHCPKGEVTRRVSEAADSISAGDLVAARVRGAQAWSLLPVQAMYSSVLPGHAMSGHVSGQIQFPGWLGRNSRAAKLQRLAQEVHAHTRLSTSGSKSSIFLDYATHLRDAILTPLIKEKSEGIDKALEVLESYHLLREDLESLNELALWPGQRNPSVLVDAKVKAAMTRTYNKKAMALPYAPGAVKKGHTRDNESEDLETEDAMEEDAADSDPENDALIKKKKTKDTNESEKPSTSKGKSKKKSSKTK